MVAIIEKLKTDILDNTAQDVLEDLEHLELAVRQDVAALKEVISPVCITELHKLLVEHLNVNQRHMQIRRGNYTPKSRAIMFVKAMIIGVKHCESMVQKNN